MATAGPTGVNASATEVVIVMGAGVGCIVLLYWLAKREAKQAAAAVAETAKKAAEAAGQGVKNVATASDSIAYLANSMNPANVATNIVASGVKNTASSLSTGGVSGAIGDFLDWSLGRTYDPNK